MIIIGGILQENPFFVPPDEFLRELRARGPTVVNHTRALLHEVRSVVDHARALLAEVRRIERVASRRSDD